MVELALAALFIEAISLVVVNIFPTMLMLRLHAPMSYHSKKACTREKKGVSVLDMDGQVPANAYQLYIEANNAVLEILKDPVSKKAYQGQEYSLQNLETLKMIRDSLEKECKQKGLLPLDIQSDKVGLFQITELDSRGYYR